MNGIFRAIENLQLLYVVTLICKPNLHLHWEPLQS